MIAAISILVGGMFVILALAFLITSTLFFMEASILMSKLGEAMGKLGVIAIPVGKGRSSPTPAPTNQDPV